MAKKIAIVSNITLDLIIKQVHSKLSNVELEQYYGEILISLSQKIVAKYSIVVIFIDAYFSKYTSSELLEIFQGIKQFALNYPGKIVVSNFYNAFTPGPWQGAYGVCSDFYLAIQELQNQRDYAVLDLVKVIASIGIKDAYNFTLGHMYQMPYTKIMINELANEFASTVKMVEDVTKKVIVLDCDNTLWKGVVGEDGINGVKCDVTTDGICYWHWQKFIKQKQQEGFILCLCSKNNYADVEEVFKEKNFPLQFSDFIVKKINWQPKHQNILAIAGELNLGLESIIFIDDSEFEVELVTEFLPEVSTIHFVYTYPEMLKLTENSIFRRREVLFEDLSKTEQYKDELARQELKNKYTNFNEYLAQLNVQVKFFINYQEHFSRYAQLTEKTNQFNFNKQIYTENSLKEYCLDGNYVIGLQVSDKFGEYGVVGLCLIDINNKNAEIRNLLLSCRVLGRNVENKFWQYILEFTKEKNVTINKINYVGTAKNGLAKSFFEVINIIKG